MSKTNPTRGRRSYGTGTLYTRTDRNGRETYYGQGYRNGKRFCRKVGPKRGPGVPGGLTRTQAESALAQMIGAGAGETTPVVGERLTVEEAGRRYLVYAQRNGRKPSTIGNIESELRVHLVPFFTGRALEAIRHEDVADLVVALEHKGLSPKTIRNIIATLSAMMNFAKSPRRRWASTRRDRATGDPRGRGDPVPGPRRNRPPGGQRPERDLPRPRPSAVPGRGDDRAPSR
jgi:integrase